MSIINGILLGILQGVTEFLPVSSTGHLILLRILLGIHDTNALAFDAILHLATATAVVVYFRNDLWTLVQTFLRKIARLPVNARDFTLLVALAGGTLPAVILGVFLEEVMGTLFRTPLLVAAILIVGSLLFGYAEYVHKRKRVQTPITFTKGLLIGFFQSLALFPGMSRSGAAISGGMILGLTRSESARFAFLLAIPLLLGAGAKKLLELMLSNQSFAWGLISVSALVAFCVGLAAIHFMLSFVKKYTLWPFIWYRLFLALGVVVFVYFM